MPGLTRTVCALCLSILICLLLIGSGLRMVVLCHGEDGHIAIEAAGGNCYAEALAGFSRARSVASMKGEFPSRNNCGACVDIPVFIGLPTIVKKPCQVDHAFPTPTAIAVATVNSPAFSECRSVSEPFILSHYFIPLRSIILLI